MMTPRTWWARAKAQPELPALGAALGAVAGIVGTLIVGALA